MKINSDLMQRLRVQADSWRSEDALLGRDPDAESSLWEEAISALDMLASLSQEDTGGFVVVGMVANAVLSGEEADKMIDGFHSFYNAPEWISSYRAAAVYIANCWAADAQQKQGGG